MASVIELSKALAQVPKTGREGVGISKEHWEGGGGGGWGKFNQAMAYKNFSIPLIPGDTKNFIASP